MNLPASLTLAEIDTLSDYDKKALRFAGQDLRETTLIKNMSEENDFERSLRIKTTLDAVEASNTGLSPRTIALIINCEYQLWCLSPDVPLQNNPFLSHWVEAIQRLDRRDSSQGGRSTNPLCEEVDRARVLWIKTLLLPSNPKRWEDRTPRDVHNTLLRSGLCAPFDIRPYIQMLEDEGIYDKRVEPKPVKPITSAHSKTQLHHNGRPSPLRQSEQSHDDGLQRQKDSILQKLATQRDAAIFEITRLPIAIPYLDFLTTLLADRILEKHSIDPASIITQYIQHALRSIERAERAASPPEMVVDGGVDHNGGLEYGKDAQTRYIRLLLLFIKSLIRKGLVKLDVLYYEYLEITVRYVWVKEVRDFKRWAEEGVEQDGEE